MKSPQIRRKVSQNNPIAREARLSALCPDIVISLWDLMHQLCFDQIGMLMTFIDRYEKETTKPRGAVVSKKRAKYIRDHFLSYFHLCDELGFPEMRNRMGHLTNILGCLHPVRPNSGKIVLPTAESVNTALLELRMAMTHELESRKFVMIEAKRGEFLESLFPEKDDFFGKEFTSAASDALNTEVKSAGNCLALSLDTAAVFHLMRAVELMMRSLAIHLGRTRIKNKSVDEAGWDDIIRAIRDELAKRRVRWDNRKRKVRSELDEIRAFEADADELNVFKEIYRNNVMHTRHSYEYHGAYSVYISVRNFANRLVKKISLK